MTIIRDKTAENRTSGPAFFVLEPSKYYCPAEHERSSFPGELKTRSGSGTLFFVFSPDFKRRVDDIFRD